MSYFSTFVNLVLEKPILVIFDVTRLCNERCAMCNIWRTKSDDMTLPQIAEKARILKKAGAGILIVIKDVKE
jgi:MoaA/NifB/PqqE/SkfB family radical SAM enzyme